MANTKTVNFLPSVFQTETNKKFLNATLDQLVTEPNLLAINGYVGRKFAPGFENISTYINEPTALRADYQLEPAVVVKNQITDDLEYAVTYQELLEKMSYFGANVSNQDNLFKSDFYSYNPRINADALINFGQYYWLPNGPSPVPVFAGEAQLERTFYVYPDSALRVYNLSGYGTTPNPDITLARGGNYQFVINQPGKKFYIQTEPGLSGISDLTNLSTRQILGVDNNGIEFGTIYFNVPISTAQDFYINMPVVQTVDLVSTVTYANLQGQLLSQIKNLYNGIDGQVSNLNGKFLIFAEYSNNTADWTANNVTVPVAQRYGIWNIVLTPSGNDFIVNLAYYGAIPVNNKVIVLSGIEYGNTEWYTSIDNVLIRIPVITAPLETLYYQDSEDENQFGVIRIIDSTNSLIDITSEIIGKTNYVSPNGVVFTNGLKIQFNTQVLPESYRNKEYYVEGVGTGIRLIAVNDLIVGYSGTLTSFEPSNYFTQYSNISLNSARDQLKITSTDFPQHPNVAVGTFPNSINSRYIVEQNLTFTLPFRVGKNQPGEHEDITFSNSTIGMTLPGIPIKGVSNGAYVPSTDSSKWHYDTNKVNINGRDAYGGNVFDFGEYAYTNGDFITANAWANISGFTDGYTNDDGHSKLIGIALDGYPIYGPFGYRTALDSTSGVKKLSSGYIISNNIDSIYRPANVTVTVTTDILSSPLISVSSTNGLNPGMKITSVTVNGLPLPVPDRYIINNALKSAVGLNEYSGDFTVLLNGNVTYLEGTQIQFGFDAGSFIEDYIHKTLVDPAAVTDLDIYNGRYCVTPDFPDGTYAYFITESYPYIVGPRYFGSTFLDVDESISTPDYIIISRASLDLNPWTRRNRWFHKGVLDATTYYTNIQQDYNQDSRAKRPIIEFDADLQLINFGRRSKQPVDLFDTQFTNPFLDVQGQYEGMYIDGVKLIEGTRVIFSLDQDPLSKGRIYVIDFENIDDTGQKIKLVEADDAVVEENYSVSVLNGLNNKGNTYWYDGANWIFAQQKTQINQPPLFDVFDDADISLSDVSKYPIINNESNFTGTKIFSYKTGTGAVDPVLGFSLSYRNFNNIGDIEFYNDFDNQIFEYKLDSTNYRKNINVGFLHKNLEDLSYINVNAWTNSNSESRQMQNFAFTFDGINNDFFLDIKPLLPTTRPNLLVYINFKKLDDNSYQLFNIPGNKLQLLIKPGKMTKGSRVDVLVYSDQTSELAFYQAPINLNLNAQNAKVNSITLGEMRNHIGELAQNSLSFVGNYPGNSNLRDLYVENQPGTILEQSAPLSYAMMFLCNETFDFYNSLFYASQEYTRFKNKFLNLAESIRDYNLSDPVGAVDVIIQKINSIKDKTFPWYYSGMVPYGDSKNTIIYSVFNGLQRNYEISSIYDPTALNNLAILVYLNGSQLLYGRDYVFATTGPGVIINESVELNIDDVLTIVEYQNTDGNWIPETPTKLGLYPKFTPDIIIDYTYSTPTSFIRGHDGSLTPTFGDIRDQILLELEKRIYNNIKVSYSEYLVNVYDSVPGKFRNTGITNTQFNQLIGKFYLRWAAVNNFNYTENTTYKNDSSFTYNYSGSLDVIDRANLPGSWRACYQYYYDCQTPHLTPWEMLGFSEEPDWWQDYYGPVPYTSGNKILWTDLQNGYIAQGDRQGIDAKFVRPGLLNFIPVNENGELLPPLGILTNNFDANTFDRSWTVGQWGPVETAWRKSSEYPFALQLAMALIKPAKYFSYGINTNKYRYNAELDQYLIQGTNERITPSSVDLNGETVSGTLSRATGYINWIGDYLIGQGAANKSQLLHFTRDFNLQLSYRMAGFSGKQYLKILAEQNSPSSTNTNIIIPDKDFDLSLHKSVPFLNARYSAMIIEKTENGFRLSGYDSENPFFTIVPPAVTGKRNVIKILDRAVDYYTEFTNFKLDIPYGLEIRSIQQVANIICGYERYLLLQGFRFGFFDETLGEIKNWSLSVKEFLFWIQQGWSSGSVITLSPASNYLSFFNNTATVDQITNQVNGSKIIDQNYKIIGADAYTVNRENGYLWLNLKNTQDLIGLISLNVVQFEHVLLFNNRTEFNDIIYDPVSGQRQYRLKIVGYKTGDWTGTLNPNGFIYGPPKVDPWQMNKDYLRGDLVEYKNFYYTAGSNLAGSPTFNFKSWIPVDKNKVKSGLLQNFAKNAQVAETFYNTDLINLESEFDKYSLGLIGFRNRNYLNDLGLDDSSQVKFYQGFIKEKGTLKSINALGSATFGNQPTTVTINEDWAFRVGSYGSLDTNQSIDIVLYENYTLSNPTSLEVNSSGSVLYSSLFTDKNGLYKSTTIPWSSPFLLNRNIDSNYIGDIQTAGYVNVEDVDYTIFDINNIQNLNIDLNKIGTGSIIWVAKDYNQTWNVLRVNESSAKIVSLSNALNQRILVTTDTSHGLSLNDTVMMTNLDRFNGFYKVIAINGLTQFTISVTSSLTGFSSISENGVLHKLVSLKIERQVDLDSVKPNNGWVNQDKIWVTQYNTSRDWAVFEKSDPWNYDVALPKSILANNSAFGSAVKITNDNKFVIAGMPGYNSNVGGITNYAINYADDLVENLTLTSFAQNTVGLGSSVDSGEQFVIAGAPDSNGNIGYCFVYLKDNFGSISESQILRPNTANQGKFGYSVSISEDDYWLYISAPESDNVYVYAYSRNRLEANTSFVADGTSSNYILDFVPDDSESILVVSAVQTFVPYKDYDLVGSEIIFENPPSAGAVTVSQKKGFKYFTTLTGNAGSKFGFSLATTLDGDQIVIGSPKSNITVGSTTYRHNGEISIYDRSIDSFLVQTSDQINFAIRSTINEFTRVFIDNVEQIINQDWVAFGPSVVQFLSPPGIGKIVSIETNIFNLVERKQSIIPFDKQEFGYSTEICTNSCSVFVGAPFNSNINLFNGSVYRLINQGKAYGNISGTRQNPSVTSGDSIRINNFLITFSGTSLNDVVNTINNYNVPGVVAANSNGYLSITSSSVIVADKLKVLPGQGNALSSLGLTVFSEVEVINNPSNKSYDYFGKLVKINPNSNILSVASDSAATLESTTFDKSLNLITLFDSESTLFKEIKSDSGAVWIFSYLDDNRQSIQYPGIFTFIQQLTPTITGSSLQTNDKFGSAIDITNTKLIVGSKHNKRQGFNTGRVFKFDNDAGLLGWDVIRYQEPKVDIDSLLKGYIYSSKNQTITYNLDYIDPAKGKILGLAEQEINYKIDYDPAVYNNVSLTSLSQNNTLYWSNEQVGQVWWDLSTVRYIDYEQGSIEYRANNWGRLFPGSLIDVYEWVESLYPPSQYVANGGNGIPKYPNNEAYVTVTYVDPSSNFTSVKYYFWVKNKNTVTKSSSNNRGLPISAVASYIADPKSSGVKYYAALRDDSLAIFNLVNETIGDDTIFHLDYATLLNSNVIHNEYALISEKGSKSADIPTSIYNKLVDSISGVDRFGNPVPDPTLPVQTRYGTAIRPRQSLVIDRNESAKNIFQYVNSILENNIVSQNFDISGLSGGEPIPPSNSGEYDLIVDNLESLGFVDILLQPIGYKVLVKSDSSVSNLWTIYIKDRAVIDWEPNLSITKGTYVYYSQRAWIATEDFITGSEFTSENFVTYRPKNVWNLIRVQSYNVNEYWQYRNWYANNYDTSIPPNYIINNAAQLSNLRLKSGDYVKILDNGQGNWFIIKVFPNQVETVAIQNGTIEFTDNLWDLANNNMGFGADDFDTGRFDQNPSLETREIIDIIKNNIFINRLDPNFVEMFFVAINYILTEQKTIDYAFKTSFITAIQKIQGLVQPEIYSKENQNFYEQYINEVKPYRTTLREYIVDYIGSDNWNGYVGDFDVPPYYDQVLEISRSPSGEFIEDAKALQLPQYRDFLFNRSYYIESVEIVEGGAGYTIPPVVTITGSANGNNAVARAYITDGVVSRIDLLYQGSDYLSTPVVTIQGGNGQGATARANLKNDLVRSAKMVLLYDRYTYGTSVIPWEPNTAYDQGQIVNYNGVAYIVNSTNYVSDATFNLRNLTIYTVDKFLNANDRIQAYYEPELGQPAKVFSLLQQGIDYPGVQVHGPLYTDSGGFDTSGFDTVIFDPFQLDSDGTYVISDAILDAKVTSSFTDTSLGIRPEDIIVDGGPYVYDTFRNWAANTVYQKGDLVSYNNQVYYTVQDYTSNSAFSTANVALYDVGPYASHAPEELVPGRVYDTLEMTVYTIAADPTSNVFVNWQANSGIAVDYIQIANVGLGYNPSTVFVTITGGGAALDAQAQILLDSNGSAVSFEVSEPGLGYITTPNIVVVGTNLEPIIATAIMKLTNAPSSGDPYPLMTYKIFKDMNDHYTYLRVDQSASTTLSANLGLTDTIVYVSDASKLPEPAGAGGEPGVIFINGERIVYYYKNNDTNTLGQLRRGTNGTGAVTHYTGNVVYDGSQNQIVIQSDNSIWYPGINGNGTINVSAFSNTVIGTGTYFVSDLEIGSNIFLQDGRYIGKVSRVTSNTVASVISPIGFYANTVSYQISANVLVLTTSGDYANLYADTGYIRSNLWYTPNLSTATNGGGLFNSNTIQAEFLKQGLLNSY
jgi:hypothetical protein